VVEWGGFIKVPKGKFINTYDFGNGSLVHLWKDGVEVNLLKTDIKLNEASRSTV
tara:strand:- start:8607 stop:8768 length:162 start_codon:yes stop_codon:yes gene_type:complete